MAAINPDFVVPGHCSGEWFLEAAMAVMPGKVIGLRRQSLHFRSADLIDAHLHHRV